MAAQAATPFHLALPTHDILEARRFYGEVMVRRSLRRHGRVQTEAAGGTISWHHIMSIRA
jgi:extradiol dioxygenase family protein